MFKFYPRSQTYAVSKNLVNGEYKLYAVHLDNFDEKTLQEILDGKSTNYINLGMFGELELAIQSATSKGYTPLKVIK
ncbi:MAG: hypothetical protein SOY60_06845 [Fusobacterium gastrosuis]|uniref:hypothetical protein n=1 Tax=Fusobacterium gastrosuis TaxID=1755100 RepID=UPI001F4F32BF|nr:hypothetical protein [Fusobacterium gastrosuis]MDY4011367.1 hypothetical protein [Fusobacterium gastrosuis]MDY5795483.1 hypothetical protein [Fusobacterium gastrosuis]